MEPRIHLVNVCCECVEAGNILDEELAELWTLDRGQALERFDTGWKLANRVARRELDIIEKSEYLSLDSPYLVHAIWLGFPVSRFNGKDVVETYTDHEQALADYLRLERDGKDGAHVLENYINRVGPKVP